MLGAAVVPSVVLRDFREADAQEINQLALSAFQEFSGKYSDWPALAAILGRMSELAERGEILIAEIAGHIAGAVAYIPPHRPKAPYFEQAWPVIRSRTHRMAVLSRTSALGGRFAVGVSSVDR